MKQVTKLSLIILAAVLAVGCVGPRKDVPVAHYGKIKTPNGFAKGLINPKTFRLDFCWAWQACDELVTIEASDAVIKETMQLFMPEDDLNLQFDVRFNATLEKSNLEHVFTKVPSVYVSDRHSNIPLNVVYQKYGQPTIRGVVRNVMSNYSIDHIMSNRENISVELAQAVEERLTNNGSPLTITRFELANVQPPAIIIAAQEAAAQREIEIRKAEADAKIELTKAERALEVAKKERLVQKERALALKEQNKIAAEAISPQWLAMRRLEVLEKIAESGNALILQPDIVGDLSTSAVEGRIIGDQIAKAIKQ